MNPATLAAALAARYDGPRSFERRTAHQRMLHDRIVAMLREDETANADAALYGNARPQPRVLVAALWVREPHCITSSDRGDHTTAWSGRTEALVQLASVYLNTLAEGRHSIVVLVPSQFCATRFARRLRAATERSLVMRTTDSIVQTMHCLVECVWKIESCRGLDPSLVLIDDAERVNVDLLRLFADALVVPTIALPTLRRSSGGDIEFRWTAAEEVFGERVLRVDIPDATIDVAESLANLRVSE